MTSPSIHTAGRVAVGMSGGLDSSVVAALLKAAGHDVIGLTLHLFKEGSRCCSLEDVQRAQRVCAQLGIRHYTLNAVDLFEETIIHPFVDEYARGRTPSPCVLCNQHIKFGILHTRARQLGCSQVATGHYVRLERHGDGWHVFRGRDAKKDQSYFLHRLSQEQLSRSLFPLEGWSKDQVRAYAEEQQLPISVSSQSESQDLCFITEAGPAPFVEKYRPDLHHAGAIKNAEGQVLGTHHGIHRYTVGQRKGIGIASTAPLYVKEIDPDTQTVFVGFRGQVQSEACRLEDMHWIAGRPPDLERPYSVRLRYRHAGVLCRLHGMDANGNDPLNENRLGETRPTEKGRANRPGEPAHGLGETLRADFCEPQFAVAPGQAGVVYDGDEVLGGGWIAHVKEAQ